MFEKGLYSQPLTFADGASVTRLTWLLYEKTSLKNPLVSDFVIFIQSINVNQLVLDSERRRGEQL